MIFHENSACRQFLRNIIPYSFQTLGSITSYVSCMFYSWYHHPKVRENWKVVVGAVLLTLIGSGKIMALMRETCSRLFLLQRLKRIIKYFMYKIELFYFPGSKEGRVWLGCMYFALSSLHLCC